MKLPRFGGHLHEPSLLEADACFRLKIRAAFPGIPRRTEYEWGYLVFRTEGTSIVSECAITHRGIRTGAERLRVWSEDVCYSSQGSGTIAPTRRGEPTTARRPANPRSGHGFDLLGHTLLGR